MKTVKMISVIIALIVFSACEKSPDSFQVETNDSIKRVQAYPIKNPMLPVEQTQPFVDIPLISECKLWELYSKGASYVEDVYGSEYLNTPIQLTTSQYNNMLTNEARLPVSQINSSINIPVQGLITEYFAARSNIDERVVLDVQIASSDTITREQFFYLPYTLDDLILNATVVQAKVGDLIRVNVRVLQYFPCNTPVGMYFGGTASYGLWANAPYCIPEYWCYSVCQLTQPGYLNMGSMITGLKRNVFIIVTE